MRTLGPLALVLFFASSCASTSAMSPAERRAREAAKRPARGGIAEFRINAYDGHSLKGRLLLGATIDPLVIDGRLSEGEDVTPENVRECGTGRPLEYSVADLTFAPREDEIITIKPGYWHGVNKRFPLFALHQKGPGPDCIDAELVVRVLDGRVIATLPIHVVRTDKPSVSPQGAAEAPHRD